jgi:hypothetical protein
MRIDQAVFNALSLPLLVLSVTTAYLFARDVLLPAWRKRELSMRHHGLPGCIVLGFGADAVQTIYYGAGRLMPDLWPTLYYAYAPLSVVRLAVIGGSLLALASYAAIAGWRMRWAHLALGAVVLWAVAFAALLTWG